MDIRTVITVYTHSPENVAGELCVSLARFVTDGDGEMHIINTSDTRLSVSEAHKLITKLQEALAEVS